MIRQKFCILSNHHFIQPGTLQKLKFWNSKLKSLLRKKWRLFASIIKFSSYLLKNFPYNIISNHYLFENFLPSKHTLRLTYKETLFPWMENFSKTSFVLPTECVTLLLVWISWLSQFSMVDGGAVQLQCISAYY